MRSEWSRRDFLALSAAAGIGLSMAERSGGAAEASVFKTTLRKAVIVQKVTAEELAKVKQAGFDGVECRVWDAAPGAAEDARAIADKVGLRIHSLLGGWQDFNNPQKVDADVAGLEKALALARGVGADAVLVVPCRIKDIPMPEAWEFDIEFDPQTGHIARVVKGDNAPFKEYIAAHNAAADASRAALQRLIPIAEKEKVVIAVENVWSNTWVKPDFAASFIRSFNSPWIRAYFDIGNHVKYAPAEEWIRALGDLIAKVHIKDFQLNPDGHGGKFVDMCDGSVNWPSVRRELDKIGYSGWVTIEGSKGLSLEEQNKRLDLIIAGK